MGIVKVDYGKSMYGGWYGVFYSGGEHRWIHKNTKKALEQELNSIIGYKEDGAWDWGVRCDN